MTVVAIEIRARRRYAGGVSCRVVLFLLAVLCGANASAGLPSAALLQSGLAAYRAGDYSAARPRLQLLADRGSAVAETILGVMAIKGEGGRRDPAAAVALWLRAANRGYAPAQLALAKALARGQGTAMDREGAWVWARLAASDPLVGAEARRLVARLALGIGADRLVKLEERRAAWRPWATG